MSHGLNWVIYASILLPFCNINYEQQTNANLSECENSRTVAHHIFLIIIGLHTRIWSYVSAMEGCICQHYTSTWIPRLRNPMGTLKYGHCKPGQVSILQNYSKRDSIKFDKYRALHLHIKFCGILEI